MTDPKEILANLDMIQVPGTNRFLPACKRHLWMYGAKKPPTDGCPVCWFAYHLPGIAKLPLSEQKAKLKELQTVVRGLIALEERGQFDYQPHKLEITKEKESN